MKHFADQHGGRIIPARDATTIDFPDGSRITRRDGAWDVGYSTCYCWQSLGHSEDCATA